MESYVRRKEGRKGEKEGRMEKNEGRKIVIGFRWERATNLGLEQSEHFKSYSNF